MSEYKYFPGMRLGNYVTPTGETGLLFLERINARLGIFECPECGKPFTTQIGRVVNGTCHGCKECSSTPYRPGMRLGTFVCPDGQKGLLFVRRVYDEHGNKTKKGVFLCPYGNHEFEASVSRIATDKQHCCYSHSHTKSFEGEPIGPYGVIVKERIDKMRGIFICPNGQGTSSEHTWTDEFKRVLSGQDRECPACRLQHRREARYGYVPGSIVGASEDNQGIKFVRYDKQSQHGIFLCPQCGQEEKLPLQRGKERGDKCLCKTCQKEQDAIEREYRQGLITAAKLQEKQRREQERAEKRRQRKQERKARKEARKASKENSQYFTGLKKTRPAPKIAHPDIFSDTLQPRSYGPLKSVRDLAGTRVGMVTALYPLDGYSPSDQSVWLCRCDCGNLTKKVEISFISSPNTMMSCGCWKGNQSRRQNSKNQVGEQYGSLIAVDRKVETKKNGKRYTYYLCKCLNHDDEHPVHEWIRSDKFGTPKGYTECSQCRKERYRREHKGGDSAGEDRLAKLFKRLSIPFKSQAKFPTLTNPHTGARLPLDFLVQPDGMSPFALEFDGKQHFSQQITGFGELPRLIACLPTVA